MIILDGLRLLGPQDSITLWLHSCIPTYAAPHLLEMLEPNWLRLRAQTPFSRIFQNPHAPRPGPDLTMVKFDSGCKKDDQHANPDSLSHSTCACWLQDGLGPPQASRQARLWGVLLTAYVPKAP